MIQSANSITGFHIEPTNICTLKCSGCARTRFIQQWPNNWKNYSLNIDHLMSFLDIDLSGKSILLCGNYGDPIYHPELELLVHNLKQRRAIIKIITNGSYKTDRWWLKLVEYLDENDHIQFSIDGTPDNFTVYRKNADWPSIETGIKTVAKSKCKISWKHIVFSYNQHTIDDAKQTARSLGIDEFLIEHSDRYDEQTNYLKPDLEYVGIQFRSQENFKKNIGVIEVAPKCKKNNQHFISADGHYIPCCYVGDHRFYYKTDFGKNKKQYSITGQTLSDILQKSQVVEFYKNINDHSVCQYNCPKIL